MGFPVSSYPTLIGRPREGQAPPAGEDRALAHPMAWMRWRLARARGGPYVPGFGEFRRRGRSLPGTTEDR